MSEFIYNTELLAARKARTPENDFSIQINRCNKEADEHRVRAKILAREAIDQNPLDAGLDNKTVNVTLRYIDNEQLSAEGRGFISKFKTDLNNIGEIPDQDVSSSLVMNGQDNDDILVIEDTNTSGLTGKFSGDDYLSFNEEDNISNERFFGLHHMFNKTTKANQDNTGGSRGIGKMVLFMSSKIRSFISVTLRHDDKKLLLLGGVELDEGIQLTNGGKTQEYLKYGKKFLCEDSSTFGEPIEDEEEIKNVMKSLGLERDKPGTSQIILSPYDCLKNKDIQIQAICQSAWLPIYKGALSIELIGFKLQKNKDIINKESIDEYLTHNHMPRETLAIHKLREFSQDPEITTFTARENATEDRSITEDDFDHEDLKNIKEAWINNKKCILQVPVQLKEKNKEIITTYLEIKFCRDTNIRDNQQVWFERDNLIISKANTSIGGIKNGFFWVSSKDILLNKFLKNIENAEHTDFSAPKHKIKKMFEFGFDNRRKDSHPNDIILCVTSAVSGLYENILSDKKKADVDESWGSEILPIDRDGKSGGRGITEITHPEEETEEDIGTDTDIDIIESKPKEFKIKKIENNNFTGFTVCPNPKFDDLKKSLPFELKIKVIARDEMKKAVRGYQVQSTYFSLKNIKISEQNGIEILNKDKNILNIKVLKKDFKLSIDGYEREFLTDATVNKVIHED